MINLNELIGGMQGLHGLPWVGPFGPSNDEFFIYRHPDGRREIVPGFPATGDLLKEIMVSGLLVQPITADKGVFFYRG